MKVNGTPYHTIWIHPENPQIVQVIDQRKLPFEFQVTDLNTVTDVFEAIRNMTVRGAPLIGVTGAYGLCLALVHAGEDNWLSVLNDSAELIKTSRPTAVNLAILVDELAGLLRHCDSKDKACKMAFLEAGRMKQREISWSEAIGDFGCSLIEKISQKKGGEPVNILTHCNAGWLACIDWGTATAPIYKAFHKNIPIHVWVDETRPRNQGARLTAWELAQEGVPHTVIPDNTGGHLMQHGMVDLCIVGSDRTTLNGDVANKIGTYLKALAAADNQVPFYVALPSSSIDFSMRDGVREIPIEERETTEVTHMEGLNSHGKIEEVRIINEASAVVNYGFDVTPARLITALITERGICEASEEGIRRLFPETIQPPQEGYVKFNCHLVKELISIPRELFGPLNQWRALLWDKGLIGVYPDGIGYGNISVRVPGSDHFYISGTATGALPELNKHHYALVERCDPRLNSIECRGQIRASAESMSHAAVYTSSSEALAVVHVHNKSLWEKYIHILPTTEKEIEYGTPAMAGEICRIVSLIAPQNKKVIIMGGHEEGIIAFGKSVEEAAQLILQL